MGSFLQNGSFSLILTFPFMEETEVAMKRSVRVLHGNIPKEGIGEFKKILYSEGKIQSTILRYEFNLSKFNIFINFLKFNKSRY